MIQDDDFIDLINRARTNDPAAVGDLLAHSNARSR